jgi:hypothetical protein
VSMARSIRDDRVAHGAANARAIAIAKSIRFDAKVTNYFNNPGTALGLTATTVPPNPCANAGVNNLSWPVFVDPIGYNTYSLPGQTWIAGNSNGGIPRTTLSFTNTSVDLLKTCTLLDDITFAPNGQPAGLGTTGFFTRTPSPAVSWAWMLRRPKTGVATVSDLTLVIYNQRAQNINGIQTGARESLYTVIVNSPTALDVVWSPAAGVPQPQIVDGGWILDVTSVSAVKGVYPPGNSKFYRVVSVGDITTGVTYPGSTVLTGTYNKMPLELATPLLSTPQAPFPISAAANPQVAMTIVIMDGVAEVIEVGDSWRSWSN